METESETEPETATKTDEFQISDEDRVRLNTLQTKHCVKFSGYQIFQTSNYFSLIRQVHGHCKLCFVKFWSTRLMSQEVFTEYMWLSARNILYPKPHIRFPLIRMEIIDGETPGWEDQVASFCRSDPKETLIVLEGAVWNADLPKYYNRIWEVLDALERHAYP
jgi:hypothetical protein